MDDATADVVSLVRITIGGRTGWTLWFGGDRDVLLARGGRVSLFGSGEALARAMVSEAASFEPGSAARLDPTRLRSFVAAEPEVIDFDGASAWFSSPDLDASVAACDQALNALNLAIDVGATVGDDRLADLVSSPALGPVHDALTFGLTLLGDGSPFRNGPEAMASVVSGEAATTARALFAIVGDHLVFIQP